MAVREILRLGNPTLLIKSDEVTTDDRLLMPGLHQDLKDTCRQFNQSHGWGRAVSAIQIGVAKRVIYLDAPEELLLINPKMINPSSDTIAIWDDCMSFPELLVKVSRHKTFTLSYLDESWQPRQRFIDGELSELLQHELDHLDGVLATMRADDNSQIALQSEKHFLDQTQLANPVVE